MPWKERTPMSLREEFVASVLSCEQSMSALCRRYHISRKTGYKWLKRAQSGSPLEDHSRRPHTIGNRTAPEMEALILDCRAAHPAWGPRKLKRFLEDRGTDGLPSKSTIANILQRNGCIDPAEAQKHTPWKRFERSYPNALWQMDFKGEFCMLDGNKCYPLTILDDHSRYSLCLEAMENQRYERFYPVFTRVLQEFGLPREILCDHGKPWSDSKGGITQFDVWMMQLGILPIHGRMLHPQTQGKEERFHRTMKAELLKHRPMLDLGDAQKAFASWRQEYNYERPHEALDMNCPIHRYTPSKRTMPETLKEPEYDAGTKLRKVNYKGYVSILRKRYYLSEALVGKLLSLRDGADDTVILSYGAFDIARIRLDENTISRHISHASKV